MLDIERPQQSPYWQVLAQEIYLKSLPHKAMCNKPTPIDLFFTAVDNLSRSNKYHKMTKYGDKLRCVEHLGLLFGIDCLNSIIIARTILCHRPPPYRDDRFLDL